MLLTSIEISNWKCFQTKRVDFDSNLNVLTWQNGTGKSSLIESIIFALFNKRPNGLDFDSLRNDLSKPCEIRLYFTHDNSDYMIDRSFGGKNSKSELYRDGTLISRTVKETQDNINKILPESLAEGLWGHNALSLSPILKTEYLFDILESEFKEPLEIKKYFQTEKTSVQKRLSSLKKTLTNQKVTQKQVDEVHAEILELEGKIKSKVFVNDADVIKARNCKQEYPHYKELKEKLSKMSAEYDIDLSRRLNGLLRNENITTKEHWDSYFANIEKEIQLEKAKSSNLHPLTKYPKNIVDSLLAESKRENHCIVCGGPYKPIVVEYDKIDHDKIVRLEKILEDKNYDFNKIVQSINYYRVEKQVNDLKYLDEWDWQSILNKYDAEAKKLYEQLDQKKVEYDNLKSDLAQITEVLKLQKEYDLNKECIEITEQYIDEAKEYYSNSILTVAGKMLTDINSRYSNLSVDAGVYKVNVYTEDFSNMSYLPVASLSAGEKTLVSLCLILAVRNLFIPEVPLIFDESFSHLDGGNFNNINELIKKDYGQWIIVSHNFEFK